MKQRMWNQFWSSVVLSLRSLQRLHSLPLGAAPLGRNAADCGDSSAAPILFLVEVDPVSWCVVSCAKRKWDVSDDPIGLSKWLRIDLDGMRRKQDFDDDEEEEEDRFSELITFGKLCSSYGNFQKPQISWMTKSRPGRHTSKEVPLSITR